MAVPKIDWRGDPDEIEDMMEEKVPRLKEPKVQKRPGNIGQHRRPTRSPRPWIERTER